MTLTWFEPDEDGGSPITGYWIEKLDPESDKWIRCNKMPIKDTTFRYFHIMINMILMILHKVAQNFLHVSGCRVKGLTAKKKYRFRVLAENLAGPGKPSAETDPVLIKDPIGISRHPVLLLCIGSGQNFCCCPALNVEGHGIG